MPNINGGQLNLLFKEALATTLLTLKSLLQKKQHMILWPTEEPDFLPNGSFNNIRVVLKPRILSILDVQQTINKVPQVSELCMFVANSNLSEQLVANQAATSATEQVFHRLFWPFLMHYFSEVENLDFDENMFRNSYEEMMVYFSSDTVRLVFTVPLLGFDADSKQTNIDLSPHVSIRDIPLELKKQLWHDTIISSSWSKEDVTSAKYQAVFTEDVPKTDLFSYSTYPEVLEDFQALLRVVKREPISIMCVLLSLSPWYLGSYTTVIPRYLHWATTNTLIGRYILADSFQRQVIAPPFSSEDVENLKSTWNSLVNMRNEHRLVLALRRFSLSYDRPNPADKLIDLWVGLETLFSTGLRQELRYRISLRMAYFLDKNRNSREEMFKDIKASYDCRSSIVHGSCKPKEDLCTKINQTEDYLAKSITSCLYSQTVPSAEELEAKILAGR